MIEYCTTYTYVQLDLLGGVRKNIKHAQHFWKCYCMVYIGLNNIELLPHYDMSNR